MYPDPTDGCPECGSVGAEHGEGCTYPVVPPALQRTAEPSPSWRAFCQFYQHPEHRHCRHGHVTDCPDPGECDLID